MVDACDRVLSDLTRVNIAHPVVTAPLAITPDLVIIDTRDFIIRFDGSYIPDVGSGIGISVSVWIVFTCGCVRIVVNVQRLKGSRVQ